MRQAVPGAAPGRFRLGYATNAFPAECLAELSSSVAGPLRRVAQRVAAGKAHGQGLGLELRLSGRAAGELAADSTAQQRLARELAEARLEVISVNGFSPSDFHTRRVKEDAYRPTWLEPGRSDYTRSLAEIFAALLPSGASGAISTAPGSFKSFGHDEELLARVAESYADMAGFLAALEERSGRRILLAIEPEPGCSIESTDELLVFYERHLLTVGRRRLALAGIPTAAKAEELLRRHIAVTFDTAHLSVQFEDLGESARRIAEAGIRIAKIHATSAIRLPRPADHPEAVAQLARYACSPYLHQVVAADASGKVRYCASDLAALLAEEGWIAGCEELRVHFHLPLHLDRLGTLDTTGGEAVAAVRSILSRGLCDTVILETYTWKLLEPLTGLAAGGIEEAVARELEWARGAFLGGLPAQGR